MKAGGAAVSMLNVGKTKTFSTTWQNYIAVGPNQDSLVDLPVRSSYMVKEAPGLDPSPYGASVTGDSTHPKPTTKRHL